MTPPHNRYLADGSGVLATVTFEVVGYGCSAITLGAPETGLSNKYGENELRNIGTGELEYCYGEILRTPPGQPPYMEPYEPWLNILSEGSGFFSNEGFPPGLSADLVRRSAWPEHHHYDVSKDEDGNQTLYAKVKNLGTLPAWVKAVFNVTGDDGLSTILETEPMSIETEAIVDLSANFGPLTDEDAGKYSISAECYYSHNEIWWAQGEKTKTFRFAIVP